MSVAVALATNASIQSTTAAIEASRAAYVACMGYVSGYKHEGASMPQIKQYTSCVERLYPDPSPPVSLSERKLMVGGLLLAIIIAIVVSHFRKDGVDLWIETYILYPLTYIFFSSLAVLLAGLGLFGIKFLFS